MEAEQRRLWHPVSRVLHIASAGKADERLTISKPYGNPPFRRVDPLETVFLAKPRVSLIEDRERVIVYNVQEGVLHLRQSEVLHQLADGIGLTVGHLLKDVEDQADRVGAPPVIYASHGFNRSRSFASIRANPGTATSKR